MKDPGLENLKALASLSDVSIDDLLGVGSQSGLAERGESYLVKPVKRVHQSRDDVLTDYGAPAGLRDLA